MPNIRQILQLQSAPYHVIDSNTIPQYENRPESSKVQWWSKKRNKDQDVVVIPINGVNAVEMSLQIVLSAVICGIYYVWWDEWVNR